MGRIAGIVALSLALLAGYAVADDDDFIMGNYHGQFDTDAWQTRTLRAEVAATAKLRYRAVFHVGGEGLDTQRVEITGRRNREEDKHAVFSGEADLGEALGGEYVVEGRIENETFTGTFKGKGRRAQTAPFTLKRVFLEPPTRGMAPPDGAIVLMDGKNMDAWHTLPHWQLLGDGSAQVVPTNLVSKEEFGDALIHVEFLIPFMPNASGQARGNSGVYVQGRYEVQVLDSFGDLPMDNLCGGIYKKAVPLVCASLPPLQWQTYDITFRAPRFDANGNKIQHAEITVVHNGITIHDNVILDGVTAGGVSAEEASVGVLMLQDHGDPVRFRNIWVKPLD